MWPLALLLSPAYVTHAGPCAPRLAARAAGLSRVAMGYVPDGLTAEEYKKIKEREKAQKNLGASGTNRFQSRRCARSQRCARIARARVPPRLRARAAIALTRVALRTHGRGRGRLAACTHSRCVAPHRRDAARGVRGSDRHALTRGA